MKNNLDSRNNHSTTHALLEITEKIKQACDTGQFLCEVFLDLQKANSESYYSFEKANPLWH